MKKAFILFALVGCFAGNAQNTFPATGNVGIGTTSPTRLLDVRGGEAWHTKFSNTSDTKRMY